MRRNTWLLLTGAGVVFLAALAATAPVKKPGLMPADSASQVDDFRSLFALTESVSTGLLCRRERVNGLICRLIRPPGDVPYCICSLEPGGSGGDGAG